MALPGLTVGGARQIVCFEFVNGALVETVKELPPGPELGFALPDGLDGTVHGALNPAHMMFHQVHNVARVASAILSRNTLLDDSNHYGFNPLCDNRVGIGIRTLSAVDFALQLLGEMGDCGGYFEDRMFAIMCRITERYQNQIEERLRNLQKDAEKAGNQPSGQKDTQSESRNIEFEKIKYDMQKLSQMQQAISNVLNTQDELAKSAIRQIKV